MVPARDTGMTVPDIAVHRRVDGATVAVIVAITVAATEETTAAAAASKPVAVVRKAAGRLRLASRWRRRHRNSNKHVRLTSAARTGISRHRFRDRKARNETTDTYRIFFSKPSPIIWSGTACSM